MYQAEKNRYETMNYNRCGKSGLKLPEVSLGLWHNFGDTGNFETMKQMCFTAFDNGITHFDLANNYGPEPGSAPRRGVAVMRPRPGDGAGYSQLGLLPDSVTTASLMVKPSRLPALA